MQISRPSETVGKAKGANSIGSTHSNVAPPLKQFYVAVGSEDVKMATLVDLLLALQTERTIAMALFTGSRDSLDQAISGLAVLPRTTVTYLHEHQTQAETFAALTEYRHKWESSQPDAHAHMVAMTDAGLRALEKAKLPPLPLFVHFDLPTRKDVFSRRLAVAIRSRLPDGCAAIVVYFVVAGQAEAFREVEAHAGGSHIIAEMPVHVGELIF